MLHVVKAMWLSYNDCLTRYTSLTHTLQTMMMMMILTLRHSYHNLRISHSILDPSTRWLIHSFIHAFGRSFVHSFGLNRKPPTSRRQLRSRSRWMSCKLARWSAGIARH